MALTVIGCLPAAPADGVSESTITAPQICIDLCASVSPPLNDLWPAGRGYVVHFDLDSDPNDSRIVVIGYDPTLTTQLWWTVIGDLSGLEQYESARGTIPLSCPANIEVGQVGSQNTNTGGGNRNKCNWGFCYSAADLATLQTQCTCVPETAAEACDRVNSDCGTTTNNCGETVSCGHCPAGGTCENGLCYLPPPPPPTGGGRRPNPI